MVSEPENTTTPFNQTVVVLFVRWRGHVVFICAARAGECNVVPLIGGHAVVVRHFSFWLELFRDKTVPTVVAIT